MTGTGQVGKDIYFFLLRPGQRELVSEITREVPAVDRRSLVIIEAPPGFGKTLVAIFLCDFWNLQPVVYMSPAHEQIDTAKRDFLRARWSVVHVEGIERSCRRRDEMRVWMARGFPPSFLCKFGDQGKPCPLYDPKYGKSVFEELLEIGKRLIDLRTTNAYLREENLANAICPYYVLSSVFQNDIIFKLTGARTAIMLPASYFNFKTLFFFYYLKGRLLGISDTFFHLPRFIDEADYYMKSIARHRIPVYPKPLAEREREILETCRAERLRELFDEFYGTGDVHFLYEKPEEYLADILREEERIFRKMIRGEVPPFVLSSMALTPLLAKRLFNPNMKWIIRRKRSSIELYCPDLTYLITLGLFPTTVPTIITGATISMIMNTVSTMQPLVLRRLRNAHHFFARLPQFYNNLVFIQVSEAGGKFSVKGEKVVTPRAVLEFLETVFPKEKILFIVPNKKSAQTLKNQYGVDAIAPRTSEARGVAKFAHKQIAVVYGMCYANPRATFALGTPIERALRVDPVLYFLSWEFNWESSAEVWQAAMRIIRTPSPSEKKFIVFFSRSTMQYFPPWVYSDLIVKKIEEEVKRGAFAFGVFSGPAIRHFRIPLGRGVIYYFVYAGSLPPEAGEAHGVVTRYIVNKIIKRELGVVACRPRLRR